MATAVNLGGATQRLLPENIPLRFFGVAILAHVCAWVAVALNADELPRFVGGVGAALGTIHLLTIGVLIITAMGVSLQMLPVALGQPAPTQRACTVIFVSVLVGAAGLISGMAMVEVRLMAIGTATLGVGILSYALTVAFILWRAASPAVLIYHVWAGLGALVGAVGFAGAVVANYTYGFLDDPAAWAFAHAVLAGFGFMGMLALGFGTVLIPLFSIAEAPAETWMVAAFGLALAALVVAVTGILFAQEWLIVGAIVLGLAGSGLHIWLIMKALAARMHRRLSPEFMLIRASWGLLPVTLLLGLVVTLGLTPDTGAALFAFVWLFGWLLTLLVAVLQRVLPFLASMHVLRAGGRSIAPTKLVHDRALSLHRWCHLAALGTVAAGLALSLPDLIRIGAIVGSVGAIAFAWAAATVLVRTRTHLHTSLTTESRTS